MPQLIGFIVVVAIIIFAVNCLWFLLQVAFVAAFAWVPGLCAGYAAVHFRKRNLINALLSPIELSKLVTVSFDGSKLDCSISESKLAHCSDDAPLFAALAYIATSGPILWLQSYKGVFVGIKFYGDQVSQSTSLTWAIILSAAVMIGFLMIIVTEAKSEFKVALNNELNRLLSEVNYSLKGIDELKAILQKTSDLAKRIKVDFSEDIISFIYNYVDANKPDILNCSENLESLVASKIIEANADLTELERASNALDQVMQIYFHVASAVNQVGSPSMFHLLDQLLIGIEGLKTFLSKKEWQRFFNGIEFVTDKLNILLQNANNYPEAPEPEDVRNEAVNPFEFLHIQEDITEKQFKEFWMRMRGVYHPDKQIVNDDENKHFIEVKDAATRIAQLRGFEIPR